MYERKQFYLVTFTIHDPLFQFSFSNIYFTALQLSYKISKFIVIRVFRQINSFLRRASLSARILSVIHSFKGISTIYNYSLGHVCLSNQIETHHTVLSIYPHQQTYKDLVVAGGVQHPSLCQGMTGCSGEYCCFGVIYGEWYGDFVVLSVVEVCVDYGSVDVFHVWLDFSVVCGVGVCINVCGVVCVVVYCFYVMM